MSFYSRVVRNSEKPFNMESTSHAFAVVLEISYAILQTAPVELVVQISGNDRRSIRLEERHAVLEVLEQLLQLTVVDHHQLEVRSTLENRERLVRFAAFQEVSHGHEGFRVHAVPRQQLLQVRVINSDQLVHVFLSKFPRRGHIKHAQHVH